MPPGLHPCTLADVQSGLVDRFPTSSSRRHILQGLQLYISDLESLGISGRLWLDGSFVTGKNHPGDVDLVPVVSFELLNRLSPAAQQLAPRLLNGKKSTQPKYKVDSYWVICAPASHPTYQSWVGAAHGWHNFFGHTKQWPDANGTQIQLAKGMLDLSFGDPSEVAKVDNWLQNVI